MPKVVDCRGLSCPQPVIETKQALEKTERVTIIVDNPAASDNVARFGQSQGDKVAIAKKKTGSISPSKKASKASVVQRLNHPKSQRMGQLWW